MRIHPILKWLGCLAVCCLATLSQAQIKDKLVVHLAFDNNYNNAVANGVTASPQGTPVFAAGKLGSGVTLTTRKDGSDFSYVSLGTPTELQFGSVTDGTATDFSVCFWVNYTNQVDDPPFIASQDWSSSNNQGWGIYSQGGGNFRVVTTDDRGATGKQSISPANVLRDGKWHHVAATYNRTNTVDIFVDGVLATSSSLANVTGSIDAPNPVNIGQDGTGSYTDGGGAEIVFTMDDLGIWRRALTSGEVSAIYSAGLGGTNIDNVPTILNPYVASTSPAKDATGVAPNATVSAVVTDGVLSLDTNTVQLTLNGTVVPVTFSKVGANTTITYTPTTLFPAGANAAKLTFANKGTPVTSITNTWSFSVASYVTITPDLKVTPDTTKPGFVVNMFANAANQANTTARTEAALAGQLKDANGDPLPNLADPSAQGIAIAAGTAPNPANAPIKFEVSTVIHMNAVGGSSAGVFGVNDQMPGMFATDGTSDGAAAEILTYIELPAGITKMAVGSDDGFRTSIGKPAQDVLKSIVAGQLDGGGGGAPTQFFINVTEAGVYAFRTTWENGAGGSYIEWYTYKADGTTAVLINDVANGGLKAYRAATTPTPPYVKYIAPDPVPRQLNQSSSTLTVVLSDGSTAIDDASVQLKINGAVVGTKSRSGSLVNLTYTPTGIQFPADPNQLELSFKDTAGAAITAKGTLLNMKNVILPAPKIVETFDSYAEGDIPTGWAATNFTDTVDAGLDLDNLNSDSYKGWIVVGKDRLNGLKSRIFANVLPNQSSNGVPVETLGSGNVLYAESDVRDGNQVQFIYTKAYDLSSVTNAAISFEALYEQNQDNIGAVEYSIDGGKSWLPVVYYIDFADSGGDIRLAADGSVDAVATLTGPNADTAVWTDNGVSKGGIYGDAILAPITQALGRFVAPRQNDSATDGKRLEIYRLEKAGKQADVRLRLSQIGTGSWYFGIDNLSFYDVPTAPPTSGGGGSSVLTATPGAGNTLTISWTGSGTLQESADLKSWAASANQANPQTVNAGTGNKFYRVAQ
jgi:hypothetical protein